jgi:hypothetical protein
VLQVNGGGGTFQILQETGFVNYPKQREAPQIKGWVKSGRSGE